MRTRRPRRAIHLIDVENLCGYPRPSDREVRAVRDEYAAAVCIGRHDHVVLAVNHGAALEVGACWPGRLILGSGPDGADLALLAVATHEAIAVRFDEVVIASGDGIFADLAARLTAAGVAVRVVSRLQSLSRRLQLAAGGKVVALAIGPEPQDPSALGEVA